MTNLEKLDSIFMEIFTVEKSELNENFINTTVDDWDSIRQLSLVTSIEDNFEIFMDPEDILAITSYNAAKNVLFKKYNIEF